MKKHAVLSPSGASRWMACTPSAQLEQQFPDSAGQAAAEGTLAHAIGEVLISERVGRFSNRANFEILKQYKEDPLYAPAMLTYMEDFADFVVERFNDAKDLTPDAILEQEVNLDFSEWVPEGTGTADVVIIADGTMEVIDLKYGKGVQVDARDNKQMMLYALGALSKYDEWYKIDRVKMTIHQPRIDNFSAWVLTVTELKQWADTALKPVAKLAFAGEGEFNPGSHCQFCRARAVCKANAAYQMGIAVTDFLDPVLLTDSEISDVLARSKAFLGWVKAVNDYALAEAVQKDKKFPGFKLVEGRSNRIYSDESSVAYTLIGQGFKEDQIFEKKLYGITAMQGIVGKKLFDTVLSPLIIKPPGKPALAPESDKRPELSSADAARVDFKMETEIED